MTEIELQKREIAKLINQGFTFEIVSLVKKRKPGLLGYFQNKITEKVTSKFIIRELTLIKLDRIALASLDIDVNAYSDEQLDIYYKKNSRLHLRKMANILAIAVAETPDQEKELTNLFFESLRPSEILQLMNTIDIASNLQDFISSTLLVTATAAQTAKVESVEDELPDYNPRTEGEE